MSANDLHNPEQGKQDRAETESAKEEFFRFRPVAFFRHVAKHIEQYNTAQQKRDYITGLVRAGFCNANVRREIWWALGLVVFIYVAHVLADIAVFTSNQTIALFTFALFVAAIGQIWNTYLQWTAMRRQLRGYVSIEPAHFDLPIEDKRMAYSYDIVNSGSTPITIGRLISKLFIGDRTDTSPIVHRMNQIRQFPNRRPLEMVISAGQRKDFPRDTDDVLSASDAQLVNNRFYMAVVVEFEDQAGDRWTKWECYVLRRTNSKWMRVDIACGQQHKPAR